jgi:CDP-diacylglycerol--glycerol-3-phosphate 3-phosphatidyltransferase
MTGLYAIKPRFRRALGGIAGWLAERGVAPDHVTTLGVAASGFGAVSFVAGRRRRAAYAGVPVAALARITANALDGLVAEKAGLGRPAGELYNETADRLGDIAFFSGAATVEGTSPALAFAALAMAETASFVGVAAQSAGGTRRYEGPMGKPDRMFLLGAAALIASFYPRPGRVINLALGTTAVGAAATALNRYLRAYRELEGKSRAQAGSGTL